MQDDDDVRAGREQCRARGGGGEISVTVNESETATNTGTFSDVGDDTIHLTASVGTVVDNDDGTWSWSYATTDGPDQSQTVTITATDSDGAVTTTTFELVVNNAAPEVAADNASVTVSEGQTATNTGTHSDVGDDTMALSASVGTIVDNDDGTWSWSYATTDGPDQSQTVTITATDSDGAATTTTFELVVNNVAPEVAADNATVTVDEGQTATNTGTYCGRGRRHDRLVRLRGHGYRRRQRDVELVVTQHGRPGRQPDGDDHGHRQRRGGDDHHVRPGGQQRGAPAWRRTTPR